MVPFPVIPENGDEEYTIDTLLGGGLNFTTDKSSSNSPRDIPGPGKEGFTMPFHEVFTSSSHTGCQTCGVSGSQSGGVQPTTGPATQNEVFQPGIDILGLLQPAVNAAGNFVNHPPDSTFASGILGGLEKAGGLTFFK